MSLLLVAFQNRLRDLVVVEGRQKLFDRFGTVPLTGLSVFRERMLCVLDGVFDSLVWIFHARPTQTEEHGCGSQRTVVDLYSLYVHGGVFYLLFRILSLFESSG
jgi:hypothetical protein